jgi:hypothetical protein
MKICHKIEVVCRCPSDALGDVYQCEIHTERVIKVEDIIETVDSLEDKSMYQENVAEYLRRALRAKIVLRGTHYGRISTEVVCE